MSVQEFAVEHLEQEPRRVVEAEIRLPRLSDLKLPQVNLKPAQHVAEQMLLTGLGAGVLLVRGVVNMIKAANQAGAEEAKHPGPVTQAVLKLVRPVAQPASATAVARVKVPVLPVDRYDERSEEDVLAEVVLLDAAQARMVREYELCHQARANVLAALDQHLATR
jgi:hypothetical protein